MYAYTNTQAKDLLTFMSFCNKQTIGQIPSEPDTCTVNEDYHRSMP